jgi:hypothetical protein
MHEQHRQEQQSRRHGSPTFAFVEAGGRQPCDADAFEHFACGGSGEVAARRNRDDSAVRAQAPGKRERLSALAALIFGMEDLRDQAYPRGLHRGPLRDRCNFVLRCTRYASNAITKRS